MELGINTFGLGGLLKEPFPQTIRALKKNGITAMEPCVHFHGSLFSTDPLIEFGMKHTDRLGGVWMPEEAKNRLALLRSEGIRVEGAHLFVGRLTADMADSALRFAQENDLHYYALSYMTDDLKWAEKQVPLLRSAAENFLGQDVHLLLHNHDVDLKETGGTCVLDLLLGSVPELELELDVGWAAWAGLDCTATMEKYRDRLRILHFKDMLPDRTKKRPRFCAVGEGIIPLPAIVEKAPGLDLFSVGMVIDQDGSEGDMMTDVLTGAANVRAAAGEATA